MSIGTLRRLHAVVKGQVQGVGFRQFTLRQAREHNLTGWVRNRYDRSVEVVAEGQQDALDLFVAALRDGPPAAIVRSVDTRYETASGAFTDFDIR